MQGVMNDKHAGNCYGMLKSTPFLCTYKWECKSFGATIWMTLERVLQTNSEMVDDVAWGQCFVMFENCRKADMPSSFSQVQLFSGKFLAAAWPELYCVNFFLRLYP